MMKELPIVSFLVILWTGNVGSIPADMRMGVKTVGGDFLHGDRATVRCELLDTNRTSFRVDALLVKDDSRNLYVYHYISKELLFLAPSRITPRYSYDVKTYTLTIQDLKCSDEKEFHCVLLNVDTKESLKSSAFVKVNVPPSDIQLVTSYPDIQNGVPEGVSVTFTCSANTGRPGRGHIVWDYKDVDAEMITGVKSMDVQLQPGDVECTERKRTTLALAGFSRGTSPVINCYVINDDFPVNQTTAVCNTGTNYVCQTTGIINILYTNKEQEVGKANPFKRILEPLVAAGDTTRQSQTVDGPLEDQSSDVFRLTEAYSPRDALSTSSKSVNSRAMERFGRGSWSPDNSDLISSLVISEQIGITLVPKEPLGSIVDKSQQSTNVMIKPTKSLILKTDDLNYVVNPTIRPHINDSNLMFTSLDIQSSEPEPTIYTSESLYDRNKSKYVLPLDILSYKNNFRESYTRNFYNDVNVSLGPTGIEISNVQWSTEYTGLLFEITKPQKDVTATVGLLPNTKLDSWHTQQGTRQEQLSDISKNVIRVSELKPPKTGETTLFVWSKEHKNINTDALEISKGILQGNSILFSIDDQIGTNGADRSFIFSNVVKTTIASSANIIEDSGTMNDLIEYSRLEDFGKFTGSTNLLISSIEFLFEPTHETVGPRVKSKNTIVPSTGLVRTLENTNSLHYYSEPTGLLKLEDTEGSIGLVESIESGWFPELVTSQPKDSFGSTTSLKSIELVDYGHSYKGEGDDDMDDDDDNIDDDSDDNDDNDDDEIDDDDDHNYDDDKDDDDDDDDDDDVDDDNNHYDGHSEDKRYSITFPIDFNKPRLLTSSSDIIVTSEQYSTVLLGPELDNTPIETSHIPDIQMTASALSNKTSIKPEPTSSSHFYTTQIAEIQSDSSTDTKLDIIKIDPTTIQESDYSSISLEVFAKDDGIETLQSSFNEILPNNSTVKFASEPTEYLTRQNNETNLHQLIEAFTTYDYKATETDESLNHEPSSPESSTQEESLIPQYINQSTKTDVDATVITTPSQQFDFNLFLTNTYMTSSRFSTISSQNTNHSYSNTYHYDIRNSFTADHISRQNTYNIGSTVIASKNPANYTYTTSHKTSAEASKSYPEPPTDFNPTRSSNFQRITIVQTGTINPTWRSFDPELITTINPTQIISSTDIESAPNARTTLPTQNPVSSKQDVFIILTPTQTISLLKTPIKTDTKTTPNTDQDQDTHSNQIITSTKNSTGHVNQSKSFMKTQGLVTPSSEPVRRSVKPNVVPTMKSTDCPHQPGFLYPHPDSCGLYQSCEDGVFAIHECRGNNRVFSRLVGACVEFNSVLDSCSGENPSQACSKGYGPDTKIPHPSVCQSYYTCQRDPKTTHKIYTLESCTWPEVFDAEDKQCKLITDTICGVGRK